MSRKVQVKVVELEGERCVVAIPGEDTTTAEWRLAYREVRKLRDEVIREEGLCSGRRGARLSLAKLKARSGWSWNKTANVANTVYERHLRGNDVSRAAEWLKGLGKKDSLQKVKADLEDISQYGKLIDYPFNKDNIRYVIRHTRRWVKAG